MATYTATIDYPGVRGEIGSQRRAGGYYDLAGAITGHASTGDKISFGNILPNGGVKVIGVELIAPELDTNASPTGTVVVGNSDDNDGFMAAQGVGVGLSNSLAENMIRKSLNAALLGTKITNRTILAEFITALASSATSGRVRLWVDYEVVA